MLDGFLTWLLHGAPAFLFVITVVVFFHELGHFLVARACGVAVEAFSIGFGPAIVGWTDSKGTRWKLSWIPLGGYVKFVGDADPASTPDRARIAAMSAAERDSAFQFQVLWKRALVVAAGPVANFVLAFLIYAVMALTFGKEILLPVVGAIEPGSPAAAAGFQPGDTIESIDGAKVAAFGDIAVKVAMSAGRTLHFAVRRDGRQVGIDATPKLEWVDDGFGGKENVGVLGIRGHERAFIGLVQRGTAAAAAGFKVGDRIVSIDARPVADFHQLLGIIGASAGKTLHVVVARDGRMLTLTPTITRVEMRDQSGKVSAHGFLGLGAAPDPAAEQRIQYGPIGAAREAAGQVWFVVDNTLTNLSRIVSGRQNAAGLSGPVGIARVSEEVASVGFLPLLGFVAFLSVSIGMVNLFPIPILDGGHLLYYGFEAVLGRPLGARAQDFGFRVGLAVIMVLLAFVTWNDLVRPHF